MITTLAVDSIDNTSRQKRFIIVMDGIVEMYVDKKVDRSCEN